MMNTVFLKLVIASLFGLSYSESLSSGYVPKLKKFIEEVARCRNVHGMAVAVVRNNETVFTGGFGVRDVTTGDPVTDKTLFNLASESKAFTSTVAADAAARGRIKWDAPLREVLGEKFQFQDPFRTEEASLRDLFSHRLGTPSFWGVTLSVMNLTRKEILQRVKYFPVRYDFRQRFLYCNYLYVMGAAAVENAACETWEDAVDNRIFKPLGMRSSRLSTRLRESDWDNIAFSAVVLANGSVVQYDEKALVEIVKEIAPAAGIYSNAQDMAKWMRFHLNNGKNEHGDTVVEERSLRDTYRPNTAFYIPALTRPRYPVDDVTFSYAMGWRNGIYNGYKTLYHPGGYNDYQGTLTLLPEEGLGVWVHLSGADSGRGLGARRTITYYALDTLLGEEPWLNSSTACTFPAPWVVKHKEELLPTVSTSTQTTLYPRPNIFINTTLYFGSYHHPAFGTVEIYEDERHLLAFRYGVLMQGYIHVVDEKFYQILYPPLDIKHLEYQSMPYGFPVTFLKETDGSIESVQFHYLDFSMPPVFTRTGRSHDDNAITKDFCSKSSSKPPSTSAGPPASDSTQVRFKYTFLLLLGVSLHYLLMQ